MCLRGIAAAAATQDRLALTPGLLVGLVVVGRCDPPPPVRPDIDAAGAALGFIAQLAHRFRIATGHHQAPPVLRAARAAERATASACMSAC